MKIRSDAAGKVLFSFGHLSCCPKRIFVELNLCRPIPIARAKTYFELSRIGRRDCVACTFLMLPCWYCDLFVLTSLTF